MASELFRTLVRAEYTLLSTPLRAADRAAAQRFPADSPLRATLERGIDTLDALAERLLGTGSEAEPAPAATTPSSKPSPRPAAAPNAADDVVDPSDAEPTNAEPTNAEPTGATAQDVTPDPAPVPASVEDPGHAEEVERVAEELREEQDEAALTGELAAAPDDERQRMADLRARHLVEEFEAEQRARHEQFEQS